MPKKIKYFSNKNIYLAKKYVWSNNKYKFIYYKK